MIERYLFPDESVEILFIPRGRVLGAYRQGDCLIDVGNTHDPKRFYCDHKKPAFSNRHDSCAAKLVWDHLLSQAVAVKHLEDFVQVVFAGDSAKQRGKYAEAYKLSVKSGFHAEIKKECESEVTDAGVYRKLRHWLNRRYNKHNQASTCDEAHQK